MPLNLSLTNSTKQSIIPHLISPHILNQKRSNLKIHARAYLASQPENDDSNTHRSYERPSRTGVDVAIAKLISEARELRKKIDARMSFLLFNTILILFQSQLLLYNWKRMRFGRGLMRFIES